MSHTVKEARELWCPLARYSSVSGESASNRSGQWTETGDERTSEYVVELNLDVCHCVANECAMWRWDTRELSGEFGFCGLAGSSKRRGSRERRSV
jgi:hypothetical protein